MKRAAARAPTTTWKSAPEPLPARRPTTPVTTPAEVAPDPEQQQQGADGDADADPDGRADRRDLLLLVGRQPLGLDRAQGGLPDRRPGEEGRDHLVDAGQEQEGPGQRLHHGRPRGRHARVGAGRRF